MYASVMNELERIGRKDLYNDILKYEQDQAEKSKYNGWSNYATWCVNLWIDNDEGLNDQITSLAQNVIGTNDDKDDAINELSKDIESDIDEMTPELQGMFSDLLGSVLSEVDYYEIAEHYIEENWSEKLTEIKVYKTDIDYLVYIEKDYQWYEMNLDSSPSGVNMCIDEIKEIDGLADFSLIWEGVNIDLDDSELPSELIANIKKRL